MNSKSKSVASLQSKTQAILRFLDKPNSICHVHLVSDLEMKNIRRTLRGLKQFKGRKANQIQKERHINVLAFKEPAFPHPESRSRVLGEVYIRHNLAKTPDARLRLLIHGVLHLVGFDHSTRRDTIQMEAKEEQLFRRLQSDF